MPNENLDEWDSDLEHSQENEEDIYSSHNTLDVVRFSNRGWGPSKWYGRESNQRYLWESQ